LAEVENNEPPHPWTVTYEKLMDITDDPGQSEIESGICVSGFNVPPDPWELSEEPEVLRTFVNESGICVSGFDAPPDPWAALAHPY